MQTIDDTSPYRPIKVLRQLPVALIFFSAGCFGARSIRPNTTSESTPETSAARPAATDGSEPPSVFNRPMQRYVVEFTVHRISAPKGTFSQEGGVWKLVTGPLPNASMTLRLAANGIRAAGGMESDRSPLLAELSRLPDTRYVHDTVTPDAARFLELDLGTCAPRQSIFFYDEAGAIHGGDFLNAKARIKMAYEMRFANLKEVVLELVPEIEEPPGPRVWVKTPDGQVREREVEHKTTFVDLAFSARVAEGGFLMLGPTSAVYDQPLLARPLFIEELQSPDGLATQTRESVFVISPIIRTFTDRPTSGKRAG